MKRRQQKKRKRMVSQQFLVSLGRERGKHDRAYVLSFMRGCIEHLARTDIDVDQKVHTVAAIARRLAPSIMARRTLLAGEDKG